MSTRPSQPSRSPIFRAAPQPSPATPAPSTRIAPAPSFASSRKLEAARAAAAQERKAAASKRRRQRAKRNYGTKQEMLRDKRHRGETKQLRRKVPQ